MTIKSADHRTRKHSALAMCIALALGVGAVAAADAPTRPGALQAPGRITPAPGQRNNGHGGRIAAPISADAMAMPQAIIAVTNCNDSGAGSLRAAAAMGGAVVADLTQLQCSTITLTGAIDVTAQQLVVEGPGAAALTIDGDHQGRVLQTAGNLTLEGITVINGVAPTRAGNYGTYATGGCINALQSAVVVDSVVSGCQAGDTAQPVDYAYGGAIYAKVMSLSGSTVSNNRVYADERAEGGGVYAVYGLTVQSSIISGNTVTTANGAAAGGGVYGYDPVSIHASTVSNNTANAATSVYGGGVYAGGYYTMEIVGSTVSGNVANADAYGAYGGGLHTSVGHAVLRDSHIVGNTAHSVQALALGGGIHGNVNVYASSIKGNQALSDQADARGGGLYASGNKVEIRASTISGNTARADTGSARGGGLYTAELKLGNSTVANNAAISSGGSGAAGGIYLESGSAVLENSTIAGNFTSTQAGGVGISTTTIMLNSMIVYGNSASGASSDLAPASASTVTVAGDHNLVGAPSGPIVLPMDTLSGDPDLQPLTDNGGPTETMALGDASAAIGTGSNPNNLVYDQRGTSFARRFGAAVDIGAYEVQLPGGDIIFIDGFD